MNKTIQDVISHFGFESTCITEAPTKTGVSLETSKNKIKEVIKYTLTQSKYTHLITITGIDHIEEIELCYHMTNGPQIITLRTRLPYSDLSIPTITDLSPGASLYEREVHDLFGIIFEGHTNLAPLLLPDDWPKEIHPLKKEWTLEKIRSTVDKQ